MISYHFEDQTSEDDCWHHLVRHELPIAYVQYHNDRLNLPQYQNQVGLKLMVERKQFLLTSTKKSKLPFRCLRVTAFRQDYGKNWSKSVNDNS